MANAAIVVGISDYAGSRYHLNGADKDALRFADWAVTEAGVDLSHLYLAVTPAHVPVPSNLAGAAAHFTPTKANINRVVQRVTKGNAGAGCDRLFVYFAGHGLSTAGPFGGSAEPSLLPSELSDLSNEGYLTLPISELVNKLSSAGPPEQFYFFDACRDFPDGMVYALGSMGLPLPNFTTTAQGQYHVLCATSPGARAYSPAATGAGIFTDQLLSGLRGSGPSKRYSAAPMFIRSDSRPWSLPNRKMICSTESLDGMQCPFSGDPRKSLDSTIIDILLARAECEPGRTAYSFLQGRAETTVLTYFQLFAQAQNIASAVHESGSSRVVLLYPPGLDFIGALFGCMLAGVVPIPVYPLIGARPERSVARIRHIAMDAGCTLILTTETMLPGLLQNLDQALPGTACLATDLIPDSGGPANWTSPAPDSLAILQYTSGSTALPRGVRITHRNLMANLESIRLCFGCNPETPVVSWLPPYHDMGLIGGILQPLFSGCPVTLMSPHAFLQNPGRWLEVISETRAAISPSPNFGYDLCAQKVNPETLERLDLRSWKVAICGAEPVNPSTLQEFGRKFEPAGFRMSAFCPSYGLAEATLLVSASVGSSPVSEPFDRTALENGIVTGTAADAAAARILTGNGSAAPGVSLQIVDPMTRETCAEGTTGEIWVGGESVSEGYWNKQELNQEMFRVHTASGEGPFLRTGDTGFLSGGQLFIAGRIKDLIILGGKNHFPEDLEVLVRECHPAFAGMPGAAFPVDFEGQECLVIAQEVARQAMRPGSDPEELFRNVHRALFTTNVRAEVIVLIRTGTLPRTSSGKVQRHACRNRFMSNRLEIWAEWRSPRARREGERRVEGPG